MGDLLEGVNCGIRFDCLWVYFRLVIDGVVN